jgi:hypothetical protein
MRVNRCYLYGNVLLFRRLFLATYTWFVITGQSAVWDQPLSPLVRKFDGVQYLRSAEVNCAFSLFRCFERWR